MIMQGQTHRQTDRQPEYRMLPAANHQRMHKQWLSAM